jgi:hypothetical protein
MISIQTLILVLLLPLLLLRLDGRESVQQERKEEISSRPSELGNCLEICESKTGAIFGMNPANQRDRSREKFQ